MVLPRVGVGGLLHGAYNYTGCHPRQVVFRRRSIRGNGQLAHCVSRPSPTRSASEYHSPAVPYHTPTRGSLSTPYRFPFTGTTDIIPNQRFWARSVLGGFASRSFSSFFARFSLVGNTVRLCFCTVHLSCLAHPLAFRPLIDFRSFRPSLENGLPLAFKGCRKQQKSIKLGHCSRYHLPRSRSFVYLRQSTGHTWSLDLSPQAEHRDARPRA